VIEETTEGEKNYKESSSEELQKLHPVVAIGASAGGLKALNDLLEHLPADLGMTYIIIQHLSPTHESILPELLEKKTKMKVQKVEDSMKIEADHIYVIPPNTFMSIVDSKLTLSERVKTDGSYHSIDFFLNTLAPVYQTKAIAIILSGSGTDGAAGIQQIKVNGGITFAQDESATFLSMPKAAADSGYVDFVLSCEGIAKELSAIVKTSLGVLTANEIGETNRNEIKKIQILLHNKKGVDFGYYKQTTVNRRILRRMAISKFKHIADYTKFVKENNNELEQLYKDLLINVTSFFREPTVYEALTTKIFPDILKNRKDNDLVRIWTPACASGEEAYSIAICLYDYLQTKAISTPIQIFGTDLNASAIEKARAGIYIKSSLDNISKERLEHYFVKVDGHYQIIKPIRDLCVFATHNLLKDPPFSRMDLISCQNVMIYLETNPQKKILQTFHYSLKQSGYLLLGKSETIGNSTELFSQVDKDLKIYSKKLMPQHNVYDFSMQQTYPSYRQANETKPFTETEPDIDIEKEAGKLLLARYVPSSVVVNKDLQILHFHGDVSNYLQPTAGKASLHLLKMIKDELVFEIKGLINKARKEEVTVKKDNIILSKNGVSKEVMIEVVPIKSPVRDIYYLIIFRDSVLKNVTQDEAAAKPFEKQSSKDERLLKLEQEITEAREYMKTMSEEFEATREELQSANEEVLSSNEELQSINEELETSKEELQSINEELTTINDELQHRNNELKESSEYASSILETIREPLIVLNTDMRIRSVNRAFREVFKTNNARTEGNYFFEIEGGQWNLPDLKMKLIEIIDKGKSFENFEITGNFPLLGIKTLKFNAMRMEQGNRTQRILIVIEDISEQKEAIQALEEKEERFRLLVQNAFDIITIYSKEGIIQYQSDSIERVLGYLPAENIGKSIFEESILHPDDEVKQQLLFKKVLQNAGKNFRGKFRMKHKNGAYRKMEIVFRNLIDNEKIKGVIANYLDITDYNSALKE